VLPFPPLFILEFGGVLKLGDNDGPVPVLAGLLYVPVGLVGIVTLGTVGLVP
tara:strand:+ start:305 stop:460 length:156 start_codon:yes stop_codon:yes gene_type:complete